MLELDPKTQREGKAKEAKEAKKPKDSAGMKT